MSDESDIQLFILKGLFEHMPFYRNVSSNLEPKYFDEDKAPVVKFIKNYYSKYDKVPDYSTTVNVISSSKDIPSDLKEDIENTLKHIKGLDFNSEREGEWLFDQTKDFVSNRALFLVLKDGAVEITKEAEDRDFGSIQKKMESALSMNWDEDLGLEYFDLDGIDEIYDHLADESIRIPTGISAIDDAINGGIPGQTKFCGVFVGQAGLGKTMIMGNAAINAIKSGKNVLYITFEIGEFELRKRLDSTFTDYNVSGILKMRDQVKAKIKEAKDSGTVGRFIIKEFPPASVSALDVESYLYSLKLKKQFTPDIIILDYLGIMIPIAKDAKNSYEKGKAVCEEIRALSDRFKCPILTAAQANRSGYGQATVEMDNVADSMGIAHTADLMISLSQTEEMKEEHQIKFDVIKSRISRNGSSGVVDVDYERLKLLSEGDAGGIDATSSVLSEGIKSIKKKKEKNNEGSGITIT